MKTRSPCPKLVALIIDTAKAFDRKWSPEPQIFLELLRFREMLLWITEVAGPPLGAGKKQGIDLETYQRLIENT